jgi:predicted dehydrogenase
MAAIQVGLVGYGVAGRVFHAPVIQAVPELNLKKVLERHASESQRRYPAVEVVRDIGAILGDPAIELVVIATPNSAHFDVAAQALQADKHVVVEKPFTITSAQAQALIELAEARNRIISVNQNRRWDGDFLTIQRLLASNLLGRLVDYEAHYDRFRNYQRPNAWREAAEPGGGILFDLGAHLIDQAQVLFGLPGSISADIRQQRDGAQAADNFTLLLDYGALKVTLKAGMLVRAAGPRFMLHGTEGSFVKSGFDPQEEALRRGEIPGAGAWGEEPRAQWGTISSRIAGLEVEGQIATLPGSYQAFYQNIADAIRGRAALIVRPEQARNTIRLIELAIESQALGRRLPFAL